ncbi:hypothetical protein [Streptomyces vastus]|uniref:hypothetical protein n=1 Tax=Streptomyces vastus TaxID=285451 RepID=UPI0031DB2E95
MSAPRLKQPPLSRNWLRQGQKEHSVAARPVALHDHPAAGAAQPVGGENGGTARQKPQPTTAAVRSPNARRA